MTFFSADSKQRSCFNIACGLLARREHSRAELRGKLQQRSSCEDEDLDALLDQLEADNALSDERFVETMVRSGINKGHGPVKIGYKLRQCRVPEQLIVQGLEDAGVDWQALLHTVREKKYGSDYPAEYSEQARQSRFLASRGFPSEMIRKEFERM